MVVVVLAAVWMRFHIVDAEVGGAFYCQLCFGFCQLHPADERRR